MSKPSLHIVSETQGSIWEITKDLLPYFKEVFEVTVEREQEPKDFKTLLSHFINPAVVKHESFKKFETKILIQPIDGTEIHEEIIHCINQYDLIITPGNTGKEIMERNGVVKPILVIPNFYKDDVLIKPINIKLNNIPNNKLIYYHESTCHPRKGMEILYEGYIKAFSDTEISDKVILVVKDSPPNIRTYEDGENLKREVINLQSQFKNPAKILKISQNLKEETLKKLWYNTHIYVSMAKIEGFGIPLLRMGVLGKPIIALDSSVSGYTDYLNKDNSILIPTKLITAEREFMFLYKRTTQWSVPTDITLVEQAFRKSYNDYKLGQINKVDPKSLKSMHINIVAEKYITTIKNLKK